MSIDIPQHIEYWRTGSDEDIAASRELLKTGYIRHGLFFAHLALEKIIKAHVVKNSKKPPPKIHNLVWLVSLSGLELDEDSLAFLGKFNIFQLECRYPDTGVVMDKTTARKKLSEAEKMQQWFKKQL
jgi:HEPN domain-containing protein